MAIVKRNLRIGRRILQCKYIDGERIILLIDSDDCCIVRILKAEDQSAIGGFKIELKPKNSFDFVASKSAVFVNNYPSFAIEQHLLETRGKAISFNYQGFHRELAAFALSADSQLFALGDLKGNLTIWGVGSQTPQSIVKGLPPIAAIAFDKENTRLAVSCEGGMIIMLKIDDINSRQVLDLHKKKAAALCFVGKYLISGDLDSKIAVWSSKTAKLIRAYPIGKGGITHIAEAYNEKAALITTEGGGLLLLDMQRDQNPFTIDNLLDSLVAVSFNELTSRIFVVTAAWSLLFFHLGDDAAIETYLSPTHENALGKVKVIIVDDSMTMRKVIGAALREDFPSIEIFEASNGKDALDILESNHDVRVMFLDWNMPTLSGEEVVVRIKEAKMYPHLNIIMATTEGGQEKVMQMLKLGVAGYLVKPFRREAVIKIMNKLMERL
ncbi:hypothetical protein FACS189487_04490 [Campylobacterota bacterium]|nr:hypothetical protein FACS189487_04490 [Campylobacterota bacterium]